MPLAEKLVLSALSKTGSTWITSQDLKEYLNGIKRGPRMNFEDLIADKNIVCYQNRLYSTIKVAKQENDIAIHAMRLLKCKPCKKVDDAIIEKYVHQFETEENHGFKLHFHQVDAVKMCINNNFSILTGGPGTGKTTVLTCITYVMRKLNPKIQIAFTAPVGKAARRISESTGEDACTEHKKLGITKENKEATPVFEDVLFVDESSMQDNELASILLGAIKTGNKAIFVGDVDQLPSVGIGAVLRDLIASQTIPVTMLTHTFRQDNSTKLYSNILNIRKGKTEIVEGDDYHAFKLPDGVSEDIRKTAIQSICKVYMEQVRKWGADNIVVLIPYRRTGCCSNYVNNVIQRMVNPQKKGYRFYNKADRNELFFLKNDFVMQLENRDECANGDVGQVLDVSNGGVTVKFQNTVVEYAPDELEQLALAYAMSIHKSQGSEYASVIMCLLEEHTTMLQRNLLYTGVTRAKKECTLIYQKKAYEKAVQTTADANRLTLLVEKLRSLSDRYQMGYNR